MTFDGWDAQYYGDCLTYGQDSLMHFRTKGSKNGVRRYQAEDGTWTPLGLRERRIREGFGEGRAARKEARRQARAERRAIRAAARSDNYRRAMEYKARQDEIKRKRNPKNLTDEELKAGIERLKMEQEYRELNQSPLVKTGKGLVEGYFKMAERKQQLAEAKEQRQERLYKMQTERKKADTELLKAKTDSKRSVIKTKLIQAKSDRDKSKEKLIDTKSKLTIGGAIRKSVSNIISKEGANLVRDMPDTSIVKGIGKGIKAVGRSAKKGVSSAAEAAATAHDERDKTAHKAKHSAKSKSWNPDKEDRKARKKLGL